MKLCKFEGCGRPSKCRNLCSGHYAQTRRGSELHVIVNRRQRPCSIPHCGLLHYGKGLCRTHHAAARYKEWSKLKCIVVGCETLRSSNTRCYFHSKQFRNKIPYSDPPDRRARGSGADHNGYIRVRAPWHPNSRKNGFIFEHVLIMSEFIGRPLYSHENVHHRNGIRSDNRVENLELWSHRQPKGQRISDKIEWCLELLGQYNDHPAVIEYKSKMSIKIGAESRASLTVQRGLREVDRVNDPIRAERPLQTVLPLFVQPDPPNNQDIEREYGKPA